jgi:2-C-methyl-D-erythritol 2,4-cyclodiphosphate synthase
MIRVGIGYDSHRLIEGRKLVLGMVEIPFEKGLAGHSDGDVLSHAIADALLGAAALGDMGRYFPDTDPAFIGASSALFFSHILDLLANKGYRPSSIDAVVILERPKLAPYSQAIREALAQALKLPVDCVSVKAKTAERMGHVGRGEAAEAHALAVIERFEAQGSRSAG